MSLLLLGHRRLILAHYVISYLAHCTKEHPNSEYLQLMLQAVELTWDEYTSNASTKPEEIPRFMEETLGFLACEILRRYEQTKQRDDDWIN